MSSNIEPILEFPPSSFLSDFIIEKITVDGIDDSRTSKARIQFSGKYCGYEMTVNWKDGKKEGVGLILYPDGEPYMEMTFVNDLAEGTVLKKDEYGQIVLRGVLEHVVECGLFEEFDDEEVIWRGFYRNGKRYSILEEQELEGLYLEVSEDGKLLSVSEYDDKWRKNGRCFEVESGHLKRECVYENGIRKRMIQEFTDDGLMIEYDDNGEIVDEEVFEGDMIGFMIHPEMMIGTKEYYIDMNENGELLSVSEYDESGLLKNGRCFECEGGYVKRECVYENGMKKRMIREFTDDGLMIEYDDNGKRVYEGEFEGDMMNGFIREEKGSEYGSDGKSVLYVGGWKNGLREGYGSEFKGYSALYVGEWKNGMRDGKGKELNENEEVIRSGKWIKGEYEGATKRFEDGYGNDLSVFDVDCLNGIERVEIGNDCFKKVNRFVIDGLNELKTIIIGKKNFYIDYDKRCGSSCLIMNCDQLRQINIGNSTFFYYESFECKNLPSLISIQLDVLAFLNCQTIVFESMNDW